MTSETALSAEEEREMRGRIGFGWTLSSQETRRLWATLDAARSQPATERLRKAAQKVVDEAEADDNFDGEFVDYLVPFPAIDALRAALVATEPAATGETE